MRALLAGLLVTPGRPVSVDRLIDDLWGTRLPANPISTLHTRVSQLRRTLESAEPGGRDLIVTRAPGYLIQVEPADLDAGRFRALVADARRTQDPRARAALFADALSLWRGQPFADAPFAQAVSDRLEEERLGVLEEQAETRLELGEHRELTPVLAELVALHPLRERLRGAYLRTLYRSGRQAEALDSYQDLRVRLTEELGVDPNPEIESLYLEILNQDPALRPAANGRPRAGIPAAVTELVGRKHDLDSLIGRLENHRLITLTGPGGVGKTTLALEVARRFDGGAKGGAWLVDCTVLPTGASLTELTELLAATVAPGVDGPLIVLDNCEHVIEAAARLTHRLLRDDPMLRVLATSREPLGITGEQLWPVPPLIQADAIRLFLIRAAESDPAFTLMTGTTAAVDEICRRLDGLPLALELAATRIRSFDVGELVSRLDDRFHLLTHGQRDTPGRQQTLRAVIEWSWDLLSQDERAVLRRFAIHAGGATLRAAEAFCSGPGVAPEQIADLLARLVDRSLVVRETTQVGSRFRLLESVREFCLEQLAEADELVPTGHRHARYYDALSRQAEPRLYGHGELFDQFGNLSREAQPTIAVPGPVIHALRSRDGTTIAYQRQGDGPPLILVCGALNDRGTLEPLARRLAERFTVYSYDRRGRGASGTGPYAVDREIDDLAAVAERAGGRPFVVGLSSGAVLAGHAAARGVDLGALALFEPPFIVDGTRPAVPAEMAERLDELVAAGRRGEAVEHFLTVAVEMTAEVVAAMRDTPQWQNLEDMAHTINHDLAVMGDFGLPQDWSHRLRTPTLIIHGELSRPWRRHAARVVTDLLPRATLHTLTGLPHDADPESMVPIIEEFFLDCGSRGSGNDTPRRTVTSPASLTG
ncbi:alpha/beta fold hydrolase [Nocardia sp. NPDC055321]